ncbi:MAG TPA: flagellar filament capping protein FliD [Pirellulales bacterium]|nr:flagellar filament capping protein FliD [Pirellulales bacterium]
MGRISASTGLVTGFPIASTVSQLIQLESGPVNNLKAQNTTLQNQQTALTQLEAQLIALQSSAKNLSQSSLYSQRTVTSTNSAALSASANATGTPPQLGNYLFTPLQQAQSEQLQSSQFASDSSPIGAGTFSFRFGGFIDNSVPLALTNGGSGVAPGKIQITDRSGATGTIDLSAAQTIGDVIQAINSSTLIHVQAQAVGDHLQLTDTSGSTAANLKVQEVAGGTTAASLGLAGINAAASTASGQDILSLFNGVPTNSLNDGTGVRFDPVLPDVKVSLADGTQINVTLHTQPVTGTFASGTTDAANGVNAGVQFTAKQAGSTLAGVTATFVDDPSITAGNETVTYNSQAKTLVFKIQQGKTTADDIIAALGRDPTASAAFSGHRAAGGNGSGFVTISDIALTAGPQSTATTPGTLGTNSKLTFTAKSGGTSFDNVQISFVNNGAIAAGHETVQYDNSNPLQPKLIFQIAAGQTTASDIVTALNNDPTASQLFTAAPATGSDGTGIVSNTDTAVTSGGAIIEPIPPGSPTTLGDVLAALNAAAPGKLQASISPGGQGIKLTDLTSGGGTFSITDQNSSHAVEDLGLTAAASGGVISGTKLLGGLATSLLKDLNGAAGINSLGTLDLTDRSGATASVDLSHAQTVDDVISAINAAGIGIQAGVNSARNGIQLTDTTGSTASNLIVSDGDAHQTAEKLGLAVNGAAAEKNSGDLDLKTVSENTKLASLNGGAGVAAGSFTITDTSGRSAKVNVNSQVLTVGDLIQAIDNTGLSVQAQVNSTGDGVELVDTAHGSGSLKVQEGSATTAGDLHILGAASTQTIGGQPTQVVDGATTFHVAISSTDSLQSLINKINGLDAGVSASESNDGSSVNPFRFTLTSQATGSASQLLFDTSQAGFSLQQTAQGQDALLLSGTPGAGGFLAASSTNTFKSVLPGATVTVNGTATSPVTLTVAASNSNLATTVQAFVDTYNTLHSSLASDTSYNTTTNTGAILQGDGSLLQVDTDLSNLLSGTVSGAGSIQSLAALGITVAQDGSLQLDSNQLQNEISTNPQAVQQFFTTSGSGFSDKLSALVDQLAGPTNSLLDDRITAITATIQSNQQRIDTLNARLTADQTRLTNEFNNAEVAVSKMQANLSALSALQSFATIGGQIGSSSSLNPSASSGSTSSTGSSTGSIGSAF